MSDPEFRYSDLLPIGPDDTPYRLVTSEGVSTFEANGQTFLKVEPEAIRRLTAEAMHDIAHYLRPAHLAQLRRIIDDPEASGNDRFVALDLLKNVNISAGGVLPMCQDTGTAIVMGKKTEGVLTGADDAEAVSRGSMTRTRCSTCGTRSDHPVYFAGPAKTPDGMASGSFGPTTAGRMDSYVEQFQAAGGSLVMLAKGNRSRTVTEACEAHGGFYLGSIGGPAARLAQDCIRSVSVLESEELGMEAVWRIEVEDFPAFIVVDDKGNDFFTDPSGAVTVPLTGIRVRSAH